MVTFTIICHLCLTLALALAVADQASRIHHLHTLIRDLRHDLHQKGTVTWPQPRNFYSSSQLEDL